MTTKLHRVFVYGTLKRGEPNHEWFKKDPTAHFKYVCDGRTIEKFPLIIGTKYNIPFLLFKPGAGKNVLGEIYEVDDKVLANLDILEDHPNFYEREEVQVECLDEKNDRTKSWIYFIKNFNPDLLDKDMLESYSDKGGHGLRYVTKYLRDKSYQPRADVLDKFQ